MADDVLAPRTLPTHQFATHEEFRVWLFDHQDDPDGIWLVLAKKDAPFTTVTYSEALDVALEYGWIDGQARRRDEHTYLQRFTPRRRQSTWSMRNRLAAERMIAEKRMSPRGLAEIERARADGRWDLAYEGVAGAEPHPTFFLALAENAAATEQYAALGSQERYTIYRRIHGSKTEESRAKRIAEIVRSLAEAPR